MRIVISHRRRDRQLSFSTGTDLCPKIKCRSNTLSTFTDAAQSEMPYDSAFLQRLRVHTFSIVAYAQAKHVLLVSDLGLDMMRVSVSISVSQEFERDPGDLVL